MAITEVFAGIPVADYPPARAWYERLVGRPPAFQPHETEAVWNLVGPAGWIYVVLDPERAGSALLTLLVDDLDAHLAELAGRGIAAAEIETIPGKVRSAAVTDPDGNRITFGQPLSAHA